MQRSRRLRALGCLRLVLGCAYSFVPTFVLSACGFRGLPAVVPRLVAVLGARHLVEGAADLAVPQSAAVRLIPAVDVAHALSMAGLAAYSARYRKLALTSCGLAAALAGVQLWAQRGRGAGPVSR